MTASRRRQPPRAAPTSDTRRLRGVWLAAALAAAVSAAAALALPGEGALRGAPGPLPLPHRRAELACADCHDGGAPRSGACVGCHGAHPSARAPHQELAARGRLDCASCHPGHGEGGGALFSGGRAVRYGAGAERAVAAAPLFRAREDVAVPLVAAGACARCHDLAAPRDPIAACLVPGQEAFGRARPTVCFDEHRAAGDEAGPAAARSAAWEAAADVAALAPLAPGAASSPLHPWLLVGLGALAAALVWVAVRARDRLGRVRSVQPAMAVRAPDAVRLPVVDATTCLGCYACVDACPFDVLEIRRYVAEVARPADCCGLTLCEQKCPNGSLVMSDGPADAPSQVALTDSLESREVPGLYLAGDVTGMALIRNAINQGAHVARSVAASRSPRASSLDLVIVGAGPAGLSAALEAQALGLRYLVLEQGSVADSIRSFPRGKLVLDPDLPVHGRLWLAETTKEELLARWLQIVRRERPAVREGQRVTAIERSAGEFAITARSADGARTYRAARVLLAVGRRGTPRRLPIDVPPAWHDRVHYSLADARSFAGQRVLVVGLGDVAMEAAVALSRQPGTEVSVSYRGDDFRRGKARNIAELRRRVAAGAVRLLWSTELLALDADRAILSSPSGTTSVRCDALLAFVGSIAHDSLLRAAGLAETGPDAEPFTAHEPPVHPPEEARS